MANPVSLQKHENGMEGKTFSHEVGEKVKKETLDSYEQHSPEHRLTEQL